MKKKLIYSIHWLIWILLSVSDVIYFEDSEEIEALYVVLSIVHLLSIVLVFYVNVLLLVQHFLLKRKFGLYLMGLAGTIAFGALINMCVIYYSGQTEAVMLSMETASKVDVYWEVGFFSVLSSILVILLGSFVEAMSSWVYQSNIREQSEKEKLEAELSFLKIQINPHFFFNTLNNIYSLTSTNPQKARETIHNLSRLMRYLLYDTNKEKTTLGEEITFLDEYIGLMKLRLHDDVKVNTDYENIDMSTSLPPLLFISFIENAFKHGVSYEKPSEISIRVKQLENEIIFSVKNMIHTKKEEVKSGGIGLTNIRRRLDLLYKPSDYSLKVWDEDNIHHVVLKLPVHD